MDKNNSEFESSNGPAKRQEIIARLILENGSVLVDELAELLNVSRMTIHRDLDELERQGLLRKVRNGATALPSSLFESDIRFRLAKQIPEKEALARVALNYIEPGQAIIMDEATTLLPLARLLPSVGPLTLITNFLPIINELEDEHNIRLISLGGEFFPQFESFTGLITQQTVSSLRADIYFTSTTACSDFIAFHPEQQIVHVKRTMMAQSTQKILLLDHTKFGKIALHQVARLDEFDCLIIDSGIGAENMARLHDKLGSRMVVAQMGPETGG